MTALALALAIAPAILSTPLGAAPLVVYDEQTSVQSETVAATNVADVSLEVVGPQPGVEPAAGQRMLRLTGQRLAVDGPSHVYLRIWQGEVPITEASRLSYCVFADPGSLNPAFAVDLAAPNYYPDNLRDQPTAVDQHGVRAHPAHGFQMGRNVGAWSYREISLAPLAGRAVTAVYLAWDPGGGRDGGEFRGYFDEIMLWDGGDAEAEARVAPLRHPFGQPDLEVDPGAWPAPVALPAPRPISEIAVPSPEQTAALNAARGGVRLGPNGYFVFDNGEAFLPWGLFGSEIYTGLDDDEAEAVGPIVWWSHVAAPEGDGVNSEPVSGDEGMWDAYFRQCAARGISALRLFTYGHASPPGESSFYFSLDAVGKVHPVLWRKLDRFMQAGYEHGIRFLFTLLPSPDWAPYVRHARPDNTPDQALHEAQRQYTPQELAALEPPRRRFLVEGRTVEINNAFDAPAFFDDPDIPACVEAYLRDLLPRLADDPRIFALEVMNETFSTAHPLWLRDHVVRLCHELAPGRAVLTSHTLGSGVQTLDHVAFVQQSELDSYSWHSYLQPNSAVTEALALNSLFYNTPVPAFPTEGPAYYGGSAKGDTDELQRRLAIRDYLWLPLVTGCPGSILWAPENPAIAPAEWRELAVFNRVLAQVAPALDLARLRPYRPGVGVAAALAYGPRTTYGSYLLHRQLPFRYDTEVSGYTCPVARPMMKSELPAGNGPVVAQGCDLAPFLADESLSVMMAYLPNLVKGRRGEVSREVDLLLDLPGGSYEVTLFDLDAMTQSTVSVLCRARLQVPDTAHDLAALIRRR